MTAAHILKMIESVSPDDTAALDEIDARVWCYLRGEEFDGGYYETNFIYNYYTKTSSVPYLLDEPEYKISRSRDAIKEIRPDGCAYSMAHYGVFTDRDFWKCEMGSPTANFASTGLPTEELAELHAVIQAIEYERK